MPATDYEQLPTEGRNPASVALDTLGTTELVALIHAEDRRALAAVGGAQDAIARAVDLIAAALARGGRLFYVGAGTSGRLGLLDAAECPPTFGCDSGQVRGILAGGAAALAAAVEGAEDDDAAAGVALAADGAAEPDVVCGISASGVTPFVLGAVSWARARGLATVLITCGRAADNVADVLIQLEAGPEVLSGSTRMKAGLATKAVLHTLTTAAMVKLGKTYGNLMVDVRPTNHKLVRRALRIIRTLTGVDEARASALLAASNQQTKVAVVMHHLGISADEASRRLAAADGRLRALIGPAGGGDAP